MNIRSEPFRVLALLAAAGAAAILANLVRPHPLPWFGPGPAATSNPRYAFLDQAEAKRRLLAGTAFFIDARPEADYRHGHLAGAINLPADGLLEVKDIITRIHEYVPADGLMVIYDQTSANQSSRQVAEFLERNGIPGSRLRLLGAGWDDLHGLPSAPGRPGQKP